MLHSWNQVQPKSLPRPAPSLGTSRSFCQGRKFENFLGLKPIAAYFLTSERIPSLYPWQLGSRLRSTSLYNCELELNAGITVASRDTKPIPTLLRRWLLKPHLGLRLAIVVRTSHEAEGCLGCTDFCQELLAIPKLPSAALQVRWGRANYFIASAHDSGELIVWRADTGAEVKRLKAHDAGISKFDFNDDRELMATVSHDMSVCVWDIGKGTEWRMLYKAQTDRPLNAVALGPLPQKAALGAPAERPGRVCVVAAGGQDVRDVARSSSATEQFGTLLFRLGVAEKLPCELKADGVTNKGHFGPVHTLAFAGDGSAIASGSEDGFVRVHIFDKEELASV
ncbi:unnamed protein product [Symbiodinium sp. CCMP2456]|nr:unnamed protein product [Symbiodinium sp. CCMP2456]